MECNCPKTKCIRHGNCDACMAYHKTSKRDPYCLRKTKPKRKAKAAVLCLLLCFVLASAACSSFADNKYKHVQEMEISDVDASSLADGEYSGEFGYGKNTYSTRVTVKDRRIEYIEIDVDTKDSNREYVDKAQALTDEVIRTQSLEVDTISGATRSSKSILKAIENALAQ